MNVQSPSIATLQEFEVRNPYDNSLVGKVHATSAEEIQTIVANATKAADAFRFSTPHERRALLNRIADLMGQDAENLAQTVSQEMGKTITEARNEIRRAQNTLRLSGDAATFLDGDVLHTGIVAGGPDRQAVITYEPVGVVAAITPFNYPVNLLCHKLGPAIAAGNAVIAKPSPKAPLAAQMLMDLCDEAGAPKDLIQIVHGGAEAATALAKAPIDLLSFTGGPGAGLALKNASGLVRCLMELGGNDPLFVLPDGDLEAAAKTAVAQRYEIAGQSCAAVKKLYVHEAIEAEFTDRLLALVANVGMGDPSDPATIMGPVIDAASAIEIEARIEAAVAGGAHVLTGGRRRHTHFDPVVMSGVDPCSKLMREETFGPVISIRSFTDFSGAIREVNAAGFGLQAGVYTNDHKAIKLASRQLKVGGVMINEGPDFRVEHVPFGGVRKSGLGREGVRIALREMSETKVVID
ncbi:aldehyde dehydrogenase family protein [Celeribacter baekdonensis]|uniref:Aldehyde dehydrogenase n=1 Tax=Celeribacter baekdonensis B30 TaxID=1208323 RepID=K2KA71_9RHOB|nr:aldehyde dehydrogenase family protein [Celeribacter baekdonensis]EKE74210.1 aldehyde dehydrogenase [Celeribacter baekdonensis B30]